MDIMTLCGVIIALGGALAVIWKWIRPLLDMSNKFKKLEERFEETKLRDDKQDELLKQCTKGIYYLLRHANNGNSYAELEKVEKEFHDIIFD